MDARSTLETTYKEKGLVIAECAAPGHSGSVLGDSISITKLIHNARVIDDLNVVVYVVH